MNVGLMVIYALLFGVSAGTMLVYYMRIRKGTRDFMKARSAADDTILSFNRDISTLEARIQEIADGREETPAESQEALEEMKSDIANIKSQLGDLTKIKDSLLRDYQTLTKRIDEISSQRSVILEKIAELESLARVVEMPKATLESVIPIRRDKALGPLTETELKILSFLAAEGEKSATQIRDEIGLTREHSARLMKELFIGGYVERRTEKMPYVYRLKGEMEDLLRGQGLST